MAKLRGSGSYRQKVLVKEMIKTDTVTGGTKVTWNDLMYIYCNIVSVKGSNSLTAHQLSEIEQYDVYYKTSNSLDLIITDNHKLVWNNKELIINSIINVDTRLRINKIITYVKS